MSDSHSERHSVDSFNWEESAQYQMTGSDDEYNRHGERWSDIEALEEDEEEDEEQEVSFEP